jgi:hypothetical protein
MKASMRVTAAMVLVTALVLSGAGQVQARQAGRPAEAPPIPLKVTVTISRFEGEKKTASLPFVLWVNTGDQATIQMGSDVPVPQATVGSTKEAISSATTYTYRPLGTFITCSATALGDGLYRLSLNVNDSQVFRQTTAGAVGPVFQNFKAMNSPILRDGGTVQFAVATDKTSGEVIKLDVTLNLVK